MTIITRDVPQAHTRAPGMLSYLEQPAESESLVVLVHGLGQDGNDYRAYLAANPGQHGMAITLPGFEPDRAARVSAIWPSCAVAPAKVDNAHRGRRPCCCWIPTSTSRRC